MRARPLTVSPDFLIELLKGQEAEYRVRLDGDGLPEDAYVERVYARVDGEWVAIQGVMRVFVTSASFPDIEGLDWDRPETLDYAKPLPNVGHIRVTPHDVRAMEAELAVHRAMAAQAKEPTP